MWLPTEKVGVGASLEEQQRQFLVVLLPCHQPVRLDVALPLPFVVALQRVGVIFGGQLAGGFEQVHRVSNELHVKPTLDTALEVFLEQVRDDDGVPHHP